MASNRLSVVDYVILVILLLSSAIIGVIFGFFKSSKNSAKEFLLANGDMGALPTGLSILVSFLSAVTLLGTPSEVYMFGTMYFYEGIALMIASLVTALVFMPKFREMQCTSVYEYLDQRFDRTVRLCVSFSFSLIMVRAYLFPVLNFLFHAQLIYMAIVLYGPALALSQTAGLNIWLCVISIGVICTFYSSVGGMRAVIWADVLQAIVMAIGLLAVIIQGLISLGGFKRTFSIASRGGRIEFDSVSIDPRTRHTVWSLLIGGSINALATYGFNQAQVQRYKCIRSTRGAKQALFINAVGSALIVFASGFIGVILYAYYADCDPYTNKKLGEIDEILPYFVMEVLSNKKGLPGVFLACIFSGSLSTISSGLNSLAGVLIDDVYKRLLGRQLTDQRQGVICKIVSVLLGVLVILLTYVVSYLGSILNATLSLFGVFEGPIMGVFVLGFFFPQANRRGALVGFCLSLALEFWIFLGAQITKNQMKNVRLPLSIANCSDMTNSTLANWTTSTLVPTFLKRNPLIDLYSVSYMWYTPIAVATVIIVGIIVSYLTHPLQPHEIDRKLIISVSDLCCCFLPKRWCGWFRCDADDEVYQKSRDTNEIEMMTHDTSSSDHTTPTTSTFDKKFKLVIKSNMVAPAPIVVSSSIPVAN
ncbi:unnamed protein product [Rotaria magnacalcarata]|uniref:Sodium-coupled monocarboxylate transporter 1 n=6 Tax=Rotaria magnacalcarata TaxID=392030 RepID=A0A815GLC3_9BILA|nr:unnamed protein product [Rotaria magnacalcarata]CAF1588848.1 unnamed protein product [Rotaria magnacalcarata]CAF2042996.1 unnamed protein product [Rotaria magnacalcarata]